MAIKELKGIDKIQAVLGEDSEYLLGHKCSTISKKSLYLPRSGLHRRGIRPERPLVRGDKKSADHP